MGVDLSNNDTPFSCGDFLTDKLEIPRRLQIDVEVITVPSCEVEFRMALDNHMLSANALFNPLDTMLLESSEFSFQFDIDSYGLTGEQIVAFYLDEKEGQNCEYKHRLESDIQGFRIDFDREDISSPRKIELHLKSTEEDVKIKKYEIKHINW